MREAEKERIAAPPSPISTEFKILVLENSRSSAGKSYRNLNFFCRAQQTQAALTYKLKLLLDRYSLNFLWFLLPFWPLSAFLALVSGMKVLNTAQGKVFPYRAM